MIPTCTGSLLNDVFIDRNPEMTAAFKRATEDTVPYCKIHHGKRRPVFPDQSDCLGILHDF